MIEAVTRDAFLGGLLLLEQPSEGHRAGTDAVLLAAASLPLPGQAVFDLGAGVGSAGLAVALRAPGVTLTLVEIDAATAELARRNVVANGLEERVRVVVADVASAAPPLQAGQADLVMMNPPFHPAGTVRPSPLPGRSRAHQIDEGGDTVWMRRAASLLRPGGFIVVIHRADALMRLLRETEGRFGDVRIIPVMPRAGAAASRILLRGKKGSRAPLSILPPLVLHEADGSFTPPAQALHGGKATIAWEG
jgi:tRNA1(Val) A37 N6-methylase TrmN6